MSYAQSNKRRPIRLTAMIFLAGLALFGMSNRPATAQTCSLDDLANAVDEVGASLRRYNQEAMPQLLTKMRDLQKHKKWPQASYREKAAAHLHDDRIAQFDEKANALLSKIDRMGPRENDTGTDCARIAGLRASGLELLAVMKAKNAYTLAKIDKQLAPPPVASNVKKPNPTQPPAAPTTQPNKTPSDVAVLAPPNQPNQPGPWQTDTMSTPNPPHAQKGYTIDEIRGATRGFFGTISTNLASVVEYAFKNWGRPTAYVLGNEGGGAFLAGLRYGKGTLYMRKGGRQKIYWHGPSIGYDFGAEGSRTMFLIYKLDNPENLYRSFTGIDGSAYLVGGVGITFLKGGSVVMAPIRTGIGLRIGANVGYVRFTPTATWNPF